jgi:hypothetical protein
MLNKNSVEYKQAAQALNYEIEALFRKNLAYFEKNEPSLFLQFKRYKPKKLRLQLAPEGYLNLYNINTGTAVYPIDPIEYAHKQVELHLQRRPTFALNLMLADNGRDDYPYTKCLSKLDVEYDKIYEPLSIKNDPSSPNMFMFGGGLFLQLEPLLNQLDIKRLSIFEADHDSFHASMHLIDWSEIYRYFSREGYGFNFNLLGSDSTNLKKMAEIYLEKGFHHFTRTEQFFHYSNNEIDKLIGNFKNNLQSIIGSQGFFEDERIGLAHTLNNLGENFPVCSRGLQDFTELHQTPVIIVGNGASLDKLERFIKENEENAIVVSCGSALSALIKKGIKPDIHIEQERMRLVPEWIEESTTQEEREGIRFIGLNPCHPRSFQLFEESYVTLKPNDLGTETLSELGVEDFRLTDFCLPVVGNLALSIMINMGYQNIYLAGLDCGMIDKRSHHSSDSNYFNSNSEYYEQMYQANIGSDHFKTKGNFRDVVYTTSIYNYSRMELEGALSKFKPNCFNLSDGAYIEGAIPLHAEDTKPFDVLIDKQAEINSNLQECFELKNVQRERVEQKANEYSNNILKNIEILEAFFDIQNLSFDEVLKRFDSLELVLRAIKLDDIISYRLLNGSVRGLAYKLSVAKHNLSEHNFDLYFSTAKALIDQFFVEIKQHVQYEFLAYDL